MSKSILTIDDALSKITPASRCGIRIAKVYVVIAKEVCMSYKK